MRSASRVEIISTDLIAEAKIETITRRTTVVDSIAVEQISPPKKSIIMALSVKLCVANLMKPDNILSSSIY